MLFRLTTLLTLALSSWAQQGTLAADSTGAQFSFVTPLSLRGEPSTLGQPQVYRHLPTGPQRVAYRFDSRLARTPFLSTSGDVTGYFSYSPCFGPCSIARPSDQVEVTRNGATTLEFGNLFRLSRNGRYLLNAGFANLTTPSILDLDTKTRHTLPNVLPRSFRNTITDDGALLSTEPGIFAGIGDLANYSQLLLTPFGGAPKLLYTAPAMRFAAITPDGATVVLLATQPTIRLIRLDVATGQQQLLLDGLSATPHSLEIDQTASRILLRLDQQLLLWDTARGWSSLLWHDESLTDSLLTDDGSTVFTITGKGRYLRISTSTGALTELYAPMPTSGRISLGGFPGSILRITTPQTNDELEFYLQGRRMPVSAITPQWADVQIPFESTASPDIAQNEITITNPRSPFALSLAATVGRAPLPQLVTTEGDLITIAADFTRLYSATDPIPPGSLIHFYATGLGPLDLPVATGQTGPANPPARPQSPLFCSLLINDPTPIPLELPTVIYAPGLIGVFQIDARIPSGLPAGEASIYCTTNNQQGSVARIWLR